MSNLDALTKVGETVQAVPPKTFSLFESDKCYVVDTSKTAKVKICQMTPAFQEYLASNPEVKDGDLGVRAVAYDVNRETKFFEDIKKKYPYADVQLKLSQLYLLLLLHGAGKLDGLLASGESGRNRVILPGEVIGSFAWSTLGVGWFLHAEKPTKKLRWQPGYRVVFRE